MAQLRRTLTSVETLKALADPLRLAIMKALMRDSQDLRVLSVPEEERIQASVSRKPSSTGTSSNSKQPG